MFESVVCEMAAILSRPQCVNQLQRPAKPHKQSPQTITSETGCSGCHYDHVVFETMDLCMNFIKLYEKHLALRHLLGCFYFVGMLLIYDNLQSLCRAFLLGRMLIIGTIEYIFNSLSHWQGPAKTWVEN